MPHVDKLILEMLSNRTPPTCVQANIFAVAKVLHPSIDVVKELPSLKHIKNLRTTLWLVSRTLAAFQIGKAKLLKQLHTDGTNRRQTSLINVVISFLTENDEFRTICLDGAIIAEDGTAEQQSRSILGSFTESARLLEKWCHETVYMFPNRPDLLEGLPDPSSMDIIRMLGGMISHDNCNAARAGGKRLQSLILQLAEEKNIPVDERLLFQGSCHNHLRNTWMDAVEMYLGRFLENHLKHSLDSIPHHL